jgi:large subunit ribosomal protein L23
MNKNLNRKQIPIFTNKRDILSNNKYTFIVDPFFNKVEIKRFITSFYNVSIVKVNTSTLPKKIKKDNKFLGAKSQYKKVTVTLIKK